ncbi:MAG: rhomboid family intramembrane serine protease [Erysipelotrichaceae bacterium]|nr:rhomboid family intramembrane serine protease [Solobacterium sp.]MDY4791860.1 rhomboid family intramembrane serine protease [Erysipelotrichaceae bacterium]
MENNTYKVFQLMEYFITKYDYISFRVNGLDKPDEILIASKTNPDFQVIRITTASVGTAYYDKGRLDTYQMVIKQQFNLPEVKILDVHIGNETVEGYDEFTTVCIDSNYHSGLDLSTIYPGVYEVVHDVSDKEGEIKNRVSNINNTFLKLKETAKKRPLYAKLKDLHAPVTMGTCVVCTVLFLITLFLSSKYDIDTALIMMGAQYNTFTLGLHQVYRLVLNGFLHGSIMHLVFNLMAFYYVGIGVERRLKTKKYLILLLSGIVFSSLSAGIISANTITIGLSGAIYCIFVYYIFSLVNSGFINVRQLMPTILLNLMLNFIPGVSWQGHLGGAVCGCLFYYLFNNKDNKKSMIILVTSLLLIMNVKYFGFTNIQPLYIGSDVKVVSAYKDLGLKSYSDNISKRLINVYQKGEK